MSYSPLRELAFTKETDRRLHAVKRSVRSGATRNFASGVQWDNDAKFSFQFLSLSLKYLIKVSLQSAIESQKFRVRNLSLDSFQRQRESEKFDALLKTREITFRANDKKKKNL